jgi:hypothetical protein
VLIKQERRYSAYHNLLVRVCRIAPAVEGKPPSSLTFRDVESLKTEHRSLVFIAAILFSITVVVAGEIEVSKRAAASDQWRGSFRVDSSSFVATTPKIFREQAGVTSESVKLPWSHAPLRS